MSQNAETTAIETLQGANQESARRPFSADAFRALTERLSKPAASNVAADEQIPATTPAPTETKVSTMQQPAVTQVQPMTIPAQPADDQFSQLQKETSDEQVDQPQEALASQETYTHERVDQPNGSHELGNGEQHLTNQVEHFDQSESEKVPSAQAPLSQNVVAGAIKETVAPAPELESNAEAPVQLVPETPAEIAVETHVNDQPIPAKHQVQVPDLEELLRASSGENQVASSMPHEPLATTPPVALSSQAALKVEAETVVDPASEVAVETMTEIAADIALETSSKTTTGTAEEAAALERLETPTSAQQIAIDGEPAQTLEEPQPEPQIDTETTAPPQDVHEGEGTLDSQTALDRGEIKAQEKPQNNIPEFELPEIEIPEIVIPTRSPKEHNDVVLESASKNDIFAQPDDIENDVAIKERLDENPLLAAIKLMEATGLDQENRDGEISGQKGRFENDQIAAKSSADNGENPVQQEQQTPTVAEIAGSGLKQDQELQPDEETGKTARLLLDMMSASSGVSQPQERALASDTLLQLVPRMPLKDLLALSKRVCLMEEPPVLLVEKLINHKEAKVAQPLLEGATSISEQELLKLITDCDVERLVMIAKRRSVSSTVCDALVSRGEPSVFLTLIRNPGAKVSHDAFVTLCEIAKTQPALQAPLATRGDTPPPIAFELFWSLPVELRRYILSRFLTDSGTLDKILKIAQSVDGSQAGNKTVEPAFPPKRKTEALAKLIADGADDAAAQMLAQLASIGRENAVRIIADPDGEPLTVAFKTLGLTRQQFNDAIKNCINSPKAMLRSDRNVTELQTMFDSLSFNKARTLLTYWDWAMEKTGPYTRRLV